MKFPVVKGKKTVYPSVALCPQCKKRKVFEPHSMVILSGGALLLDRKRENSIHTRALSGFLNLVWHGAHANGVGDDRDIGATVETAADTQGGQFEMYFCSTACVRKFLKNLCVDELEKRIIRERKAMSCGLESTRIVHRSVLVVKFSIRVMRVIRGFLSRGASAG